MSSTSGWRRWFKSGVGVYAAIVLFNAILIGVMWHAVMALVRVERDDAIRAAIGRNDNLAIAFEEYTTRTIESADAVIQYLIREYARSGGKMDLAEFVAEYTIANKAFTGVVLANQRGDAITNSYSGKPFTWTNVADREHFIVHREHDSGKVVIGKPVAGRITGKTVIPITRRINNADGTFGGAAMVLIEPARFTELLQDAKVRPHDIMTLVGMDGITRARLKGTTTSWGEDVSTSQLFVEQAKRPIGNYFVKSQLDGIPKFFSYRTLADYPSTPSVHTARKSGSIAG